MLLVSLDCQFLITPSSCVPYIASFSGLFVFDYPFVLCNLCYQLLWIVSFWLPLRLVYPMLPVSLDCQFWLPLRLVASFSELSVSDYPFVLCTQCCQFLWIVRFWLPLRLVYPMLPVFLDCPFLITPSSCVTYATSFSGLSVSDYPFVLWTLCCQFLRTVRFWLPLRLVYPMLPVSLDCPFLITPSSCVPYVASFSGLFVFDYPFVLLPVSLNCLFLITPSSCVSYVVSFSGLSVLNYPFVLCTQCCQFLWIVRFWLPLRLVYPMLPVSLDCPFLITPSSCVPYATSFSGLSVSDYPFVLWTLCCQFLSIVSFWLPLRLVYPMLPVSLDCPFLITPITPSSCVPNVASFSGLSVSDYPFVLYTQCCQFLWIVCFWLPLRLVYPMLPVSLDCPFLITPSSCVPYVASFSGLSVFDYPFVLCTLCYQFLWIVSFWLPLRLVDHMLPVSLDCQFCITPSSCVPYFSSFSGLSVLITPSSCCQFLWIVCFWLPLRLVYPMLPESLDCQFLITPSSCVPYVASFSGLIVFDYPFVLCTLCCQFLWIVRFWLPLRLVYPMLPVSLDCPFLITPSSCVAYVASFSWLSVFDYPFVLCTLCYQFLWIVRFWLPLRLVYPMLPVSLDYPFLITPSSCVPYVASFSG